MDYRNSHQPNIHSSFTSSTGNNAEWWVYTDMGQNAFNPTFTYLTDAGPKTVSVSALQPTAIYAYVCYCGCEQVFTASGDEIIKKPIISGRVPLPSTTYTVNAASPTAPPTAPTVPVAASTNAAAACEVRLSVSLVSPPTVCSETAATNGGASVALTTRGGRTVVFDDMVTEFDETEEDTTPIPALEPVDAPTKVEPIREPKIGDIVWSKATGRGPLTIIAGTTINVRASKLEIDTPDGTYTRERTKADEVLRLDAWLVRDDSGRLTTFAKPELTLVHQSARFSLLKIVMWVSAFASFIAAGWLLHR
jgi:hypothetical protein